MVWSVMVAAYDRPSNQVIEARAAAVQERDADLSNVFVDFDAQRGVHTANGVGRKCIPAPITPEPPTTRSLSMPTIASCFLGCSH